MAGRRPKDGHHPDCQRVRGPSGTNFQQQVFFFLDAVRCFLLFFCYTFKTHLFSLFFAIVEENHIFSIPNCPKVAAGNFLGHTGSQFLSNHGKYLTASSAMKSLHRISVFHCFLKSFNDLFILKKRQQCLPAVFEFNALAIGGFIEAPMVVRHGMTSPTSSKASVLLNGRSTKFFTFFIHLCVS